MESLIKDIIKDSKIILKNSNNFSDWKQHIKDLFTAMKFKKYLSEESKKEPVLPSGANQEAKRNHMALLRKRESDLATARLLIYSRLDESSRRLVKGLDHPYDMIAKLQANYNSKLPSNIQRLHKEFAKFKYDPTKDVLSNVQYLESILFMLEDCDPNEIKTDSEKFNKLLGSMPSTPEWLALRRHYTYNNAKMTFADLVESLRTEEMGGTLPKDIPKTGESPHQSSSDEKSNGTALTAKKSDKRKKVKKCDFCHYFGHTADKCEYKLGKRPFCTHCKRPNHTEKECRKKEKSNNQLAGMALVAGTALVANSKINEEKIVFIIDSGATAHMSGKISLFSDVKYSPSTFIHTADNRTLEVKGIGNIQLGNGNYLAGSFYVPQLEYNLISVPMMVEKGFNVIFTKTHCIVKHGEKIVIEAKNNGGLFTIEVNKKPSNYVFITSSSLWHNRFGHLSISHLRKTKNDDTEFPNEALKDILCESCATGKQSQKSFMNSTNNSSLPGELIHTDLLGPFCASLGETIYAQPLIDHASRYCSLKFLKRKDEATKMIKEIISEFERQFGRKVKYIRSDNGGEFLNKDLSTFFKEKGIIHECSAPHTPQQNGVAERRNRTLTELTQCLLHQASLPKRFWAEAMSTVNFLLNYTIKTNGKTAYEHYIGRKPQWKRLKVWGCVAYSHLPKKYRTKLDMKAKKCIFVGYELHRNAYRFFDPNSNTIILSYHAIFHEKIPGGTILPNKDLDDSFEPFPYNDTHSTATGNIGTEHISPHPGSSGRAETPSLLPSSTSSGRISRPPSYLQDYATFVTAFLTGSGRFLQHAFCFAALDDEPLSYQAARQSHEWEQWKTALDEEYQSLIENGTWILVDPPPGREIVKSKWVFKKKKNSNGEVVRFKARFVAKGFSQVEGIDYKETFAPVVKFTSLRFLLAIAATLDLELEQLDFKTAFLNGILEEEIYVEQPEGYVKAGNEQKVLKLVKSLYGLKQSPRAWNKRLHDYLVSLGLIKSRCDSGIYFQWINHEILILAVYVDDLVIAGRDKSKIEELKTNLKREFQLNDLGPLKFIIGIEIIRDRQNKKIYMTQRQYIKNILKKFRMENAKSEKTPLLPSKIKITKHGRIDLHDSKLNQPLDDNTLYMEATGSLIYAMVASRPDISFAVGLVSRYMQNPTKAHWECVKHIFRYLRGTIDYAICFDGNTLQTLHGYSDSDWASDLDDRRSTSGYCFILGGGCISWHSKKQAVVALSTVEAEYIGLSNTVSEGIWLKNFLDELNLHKLNPSFESKIKLLCAPEKCDKNDQEYSTYLQIFGDNQGSIALASNPTNHSRAKHIDIKYHFIRDHVENKRVNVQYTPTEEMVADIFTKSLPSEKHRKMVACLGLVSLADVK